MFCDGGKSANEPKNGDQRARSILKNMKEGRQRSNTPTGHGNSDKKRLVSQQTTTTRKDTLKTVAFGLTTNLDDTVLAREGKSNASKANNKMKTIIFSHEAQSLYKLITAQKDEIDNLGRSVVELTEANQQHRTEAREQMNIIAGLSSRLFEVEKRLMGRGTEEAAEKEEQGNEERKGDAQQENNDRPVAFEGNRQKSRENKQRSGTRESGKWGGGQVLGERNGQNNQPLAPSPQQQNPSDGKMHDGGELQRIDILKRLDFAMQRNPTFEQRVQTMLRVWSEDSAAAPPLQTIGQYNGNCEESCGPSMLVRVTTQRQELFYSSSPGRRHKRAPAAMARVIEQPEENNRKKTQRKPVAVVFEPSDDEEEVRETQPRQLDTVPNIRQSDHCTDDAEFFQQNGDNSGEDDEVHTVEEEEEAAPHQANMRTNRLPFNARRKREANSTIRNRYR